MEQVAPITNSPSVNSALVVTLDSPIHPALQRILEQAGWQTVSCFSLEEFFALKDKSQWLLVVVSCNKDSASLIKVLHNLQPAVSSERTFVVVITEQPSTGDAILCMQNGAMEYLSWPVIPSQLLESADRARRFAFFAALNPQNKNASHSQSNEIAGEVSQNHYVLIGSSAAMLELSKQIFRIARSPGLRVFITGETGTGKEVVARLIHEISGRSGPFLAINCAATIESLLESELFGHEKGSFTGAHAAKKGLWEMAAGGTLFLDEITETAPTVQAKLLRALQEGSIRRVGSNHEIRVTARVIAASNRDVGRTIKDGSFRNDLYYRLGRELHLPPLRERLEDIPLLVDHFCHRMSGEAVITPEAMEALCSYEWPGNVRELESVIQQILTFSGRFIFREDVLRHLQVTQDQQRKINLSLWSAMNTFKSEDWPTMREIRDWFIFQTYLYFGKESVVARQLGLDIRTVSAIVEAEKRKAACNTTV